jgi:hypothetical protein
LVLRATIKGHGESTRAKEQVVLARDEIEAWWGVGQANFRLPLPWG